MKKIIIILLAWSICQLGYAQKNRSKGKNEDFYGKQCAHLGLGWNYSALDLQGYNYALARFGETRNNTNLFSQLTNLQGPSVTLSFHGAKENKKFTRYLFEVGFSGRWNRQKILDPNNNQDLTVKINASSAHLRIGTLPVHTTNFDIGLGLGLDGMLVNVSTAQATNALESIQQNIGLGASVFMPIYWTFGYNSNVALGIRPYYQYQFQTLDFSELNKKINPQTYANDPLEAQKARFSNFGLEVQLVILFHKHFLSKSTHKKKQK
ncbi:MAG: hypothetical protein MUE85_11770 [Microscillaceae bacterium]|jgi:hypothetical protein|nr:hypothetical protein [Microscillaceae bacterium]